MSNQCFLCILKLVILCLCGGEEKLICESLNTFLSDQKLKTWPPSNSLNRINKTIYASYIYMYVLYISYERFRKKL